MLNLNYAQVSYIRDLLRQELYRIWQDEYVPRIKEVNLIKAKKRFDNSTNPFHIVGMINCILKIIDEYEEEIQKELKVK